MEAQGVVERVVAVGVVSRSIHASQVVIIVVERVVVGQGVDVVAVLVAVVSSSREAVVKLEKW